MYLCVILAIPQWVGYTQHRQLSSTVADSIQQEANMVQGYSAEEVKLREELIADIRKSLDILSETYVEEADEE